MTTDSHSQVVTALVGVYDADGGFAGELRYVVGHLLGRLECALCDITHRGVRRKDAFDEMLDRLGVPFSVVHRNERTEVIAAATEAAPPCVVAVTDAGLVIVMGRSELSACGGDVDRFEHSLRESLATRGLVLVGSGERPVGDH